MLNRCIMKIDENENRENYCIHEAYIPINYMSSFLFIEALSVLFTALDTQWVPNKYLLNG